MTCPVCAKDPISAYRPFCSRRCADIDLGRWLNESYRVPDEEPEDINPPNPDVTQQRPQ
jgi:uncharacterized protein